MLQLAIVLEMETMISDCQLNLTGNENSFQEPAKFKALKEKGKLKWKRKDISTDSACTTYFWQK